MRRGHHLHESADGAEVELFSVAGHDGHLREVNQPFADLLGLPEEQVNGRSLLELVHPQDVADVVVALGALEQGAPEVLLENRFAQSGGRWVHLQWVARPVPGTDLWWACGRDTTRFHELLAEQVNLRAQLDLALGQATAAMWELDLPSHVLTWERQVASVLDVGPTAVPATAADLAAALHPDDAPAVLAALMTLGETGSIHVGARLGTEEGDRYVSIRGRVLDRDHRGRARRAVGLLLDVTQEKAMEEQMLRMVMTDALTGVPNRRAFDQTLRTQWRRCTSAMIPLSVIMIDIDDFKTFNDDFGHLIGDDALCAVARALTSAVHRPGDVLARFGGEEFALVLPGAGTAEALAVAARLNDAVRALTLRQTPNRTLTVSIGTASWHPGSQVVKPAHLLTRSDQALYAAKLEGKDRAVAYEVSIAARMDFEAAIAHGLSAGEFELHYQPVVDLADGDVVGFEALSRWNRPGHGLIPPDDFIPAAEASTLICDLGRWVLRTATAQLAAWTDEGLDPGRRLRLAVNASALHISDPSIVDDIKNALRESGTAPARLEIELTETALVDNDLISQNLARIRALGVSVAIDDFGTGYTSVGQLPQLPVDTLKIDRSFVASHDPRQRALVALMIEAAHAFDLRVVAEGIEDVHVLEALRDLSCDTAQGYLFSRPLPGGSVPDWMRTWRGIGAPPTPDEARRARADLFPTSPEAGTSARPRSG